VEDVVPLSAIDIDLRLPAGKRCVRVEAVVAKQTLPFEVVGGRVRVRLALLEEFESVLFELG
jgi:hypothetical protein